MHSDTNNTTADSRYDAVALLSGGLDSILAVKVIQDQGLRVKCLHFVAPFFGKPHKRKHWEALYGIDIENVDISEEYVRLLTERPVYGFGKVLNPCVDCKILMMRKASELMHHYGAKFIISGEVLGQRPMSQRQDTLNVIRRDAEVKEVLLRPLCAKHLDPTEVELSGLVDRERLLGIKGRGRSEQLALAKHYGFAEIPTPGGGCKLAEKENARRYWPILKFSPKPSVRDFKLSNIGRQYWAEDRWMIVGRNHMDNSALLKVCGDADLVFRLRGFPGPIAVGRQFDGKPWTQDEIADAAALAASFSPKAVQSGKPVMVRVVAAANLRRLAEQGGEHAPVEGEVVFTVEPKRVTDKGWSESDWPTVREEIRADMRDKRA
ncbi:tRNA(5-methylaminomethyl-2-thiouridylate) methyltransferase [Desulfovibrio mangrovi]|uniref:tRNA(5-methylaminomethyl-2-thiouridylate) methyltransferase n=1 Tax=Desulfovibrio mangrovi TaxID=2976983 RepID=UPI002246C6C4|nr:tRNA(5-methylaminomethyl-2-thiouridylate) methyltransferase [Desulfovibrio mangrovi]UZP67984.1 tRNA(5-methylaminomethyl-2-thiouridylate) methyltransferase [Desulfovibrio mangrovi]